LRRDSEAFLWHYYALELLHCTVAEAKARTGRSAWIDVVAYLEIKQEEQKKAHAAHT